MLTFRGEATGYGCAFCGGALPFASPEGMLVLRVDQGGRQARFWAHPACFRERVTPDLWPMVDAIPPARAQDIHPPAA